jgi:hypothetical protein
MAQHPSEVTPAFTTDRLQLISDAIRRVRLDALDIHQPEKGDNAWTFGCTCYARTLKALRDLEASGDHPYLRLMLDGLACTIYIDDVPLKFYRGEAANPSERSLRRGLQEAMYQVEMAFLEEERAAELDGWVWMLAVETLDDGTVASTAVFQMNRNREHRHLWYIPEEPVAVAASVDPVERDGVDLEPVQIGPKPVGKEDIGDGSK